MSDARADHIVMESERFLLRELGAEDADDLLEALGDPEAMCYYPHAFSREEVLGWIDRSRHSYEHGFGLWGLVLKESGELVGDCGLTLQEVDGERLVEVGYHLKRAHWHRGLATEGARTCCHDAFRTLGVDLVIGLVRAENAPSAAVAGRVGMRAWKPVAVSDHRTSRKMITEIAPSRHPTRRLQHRREGWSPS